MAAYFRLQDLIKVSGVNTQEREGWIDVGGYRHVVLQTRIPVQAASGGTLYFQHAAVPEEDAFVDIDSTNIKVALSTSNPTNVVLVVEDPLRFIRWRTDNVNADAQFLTDAIAR